MNRRMLTVMFVGALAAAGCTPGQSSPDAQNTTGHSISGTATGPAGVTMNLTGAATGSTTTGQGGHYQFGGLADGTYTVTPGIAGYAFVPVSTAATLSGADLGGIDFAGTVNASPSHSISGTATGPAGVTMNLTGAATGSTTTGQGGQYQFDGLLDGAYTVTPGIAGYAFAPASTAVTLSGADLGGIDFAGTVNPSPTHSISGAVTGPAGVTVNLTGAATVSTTTGQGGHYQFDGLADGAYTVTPSSGCYSFAPSFAAVTLSGADLGAIDFKGTVQLYVTHKISGTISPAIKGVAIRITGASAATVYTNASGAYALGLLAPGAYTVSADPDGWPSSPSSRSVTLCANDVSADFALDLSAPTIVLFASSESHDGNLGGRAGADAICATTRQALPLSCGTVHAVLEVDTADSVANMPVNYQLPTSEPVRRPTGVLIDSSWTAMFDGTLINSAGGGTAYWTGGGGTPTYPLTCTGWTSNSSTITGRFGIGNVTDMRWIKASNYWCNQSNPLLCACW